MQFKEVKEQIYDIVLAARTEGIIGGKTKGFAQSDTDQILSLDGLYVEVEGELPDIEGIFASVNKMPKETHKRVSGDKWRYIKAIESKLSGYKKVRPTKELVKEVKE